MSGLRHRRIPEPEGRVKYHILHVLTSDRDLRALKQRNGRDIPGHDLLDLLELVLTLGLVKLSCLLGNPESWKCATAQNRRAWEGLTAAAATCQWL